MRTGTQLNWDGSTFVSAEGPVSTASDDREDDDATLSLSMDEESSVLTDFELDVEADLDDFE